MSSNTDITKLDLYGILGVAEDTTEKQIVKAYRKQALKCHPDKNPDNPEAAELFHKLSKALEVLTDAAARAAYDKILKAKKAAAARHKELDAKRKRFKEDLEARENAAQGQKVSDVAAKRDLEAEIARLRKEGSRLLHHEQEILKEEIRKQAVVKEIETPKLKIKWKATKDDDSNGGYSYETLYKIFYKYGEILNLMVSTKKKGSGLIEFRSAADAEMAFQTEVGHTDNPVILSWLQGRPPPGQAPTKPTDNDNMATNVTPGDSGAETDTKQQEVPVSSMPSFGRDFESLVLMRLRQAEERKRLIEQMQKEDDQS